MKRKMKREETIRGIRAARALPTDKHPGSLSDKKMYFYARVSTPEQVMGSQRPSSRLRRKHGKADDNNVT